jgi:uncharacterized membrane protein
MEQTYGVVTRPLIRWLVPLGAVLALSAWLYVAPPGLLGKLDAIGYAVCHRLDSHSLHIGTLQMPLCARCTGEFNAAAVALVFQGLLSGRGSHFPRRGILAALGVLFLAFGLDGLNSYVGLIKTVSPGALAAIPNPYVTSDVTRVFTGSGMGLVLAAVLYPMYNATVWRAPRAAPTLTWRQFGTLVAMLLVLDAAILTESPYVLYPVALVSALGVLALLGMVFSIAWVMIMRQDNTFEHVGELWLPALAGLTLAFVLILGIDWVRFSLTQTWGGFPGLNG